MAVCAAGRNLPDHQCRQHVVKHALSSLLASSSMTTLPSKPKLKPVGGGRRDWEGAWPVRSLFSRGFDAQG